MLYKRNGNGSIDELKMPARRTTRQWLHCSTGAPSSVQPAYGVAHLSRDAGALFGVDSFSRNSVQRETKDWEEAWP